eukprot:gene19186-29545_t
MDAAEDEDSPFTAMDLALELENDTPPTILEKAGVSRGFVCHFARIVDDSVAAKKWYDLRTPIVLVPVRPDYIEPVDTRSLNPAARLVAAGVPVSRALKALARAFWHTGFHEFSAGATAMRRLVETMAVEPYADRVDYLTTDQYGLLGPIGAFNDHAPADAPDLVLPPHALGHLEPLQVDGLWNEAMDYRALSLEEQAELIRRGQAWNSRKKYLEEASAAVVCVFAYHDTGRTRAKLGTTSRTFREFRLDDDAAATPPADNTDPRGGYQQPNGAPIPPKKGKFAESPFRKDDAADGGEGRGMRAGSIPGGASSYSAVFGRPEAPATEKVYSVRSFTAFFVTPTILMCTRSCAFDAEGPSYSEEFFFTRHVRTHHTLLTRGVDLFRCAEIRKVSPFLVDKVRAIGVELAEEKVPPGNLPVQWNDIMLLEVPESCQSAAYLLPEMDPVAKSADAAAIFYAARPSNAWIHRMAGPPGLDVSGDRVNRVTDLCFGYEAKVASLGRCSHPGAHEVFRHSCAHVPGARGCPIVAGFVERVVDEPPGTTAGARDAADPDAGEEASKTTRQLNMYNAAISVRHVSLVLVYQEFVLPYFVGKPEEAYLTAFLRPYDVFVKNEVLTLCHRKMLKDAEDQNDW